MESGIASTGLHRQTTNTHTHSLTSHFLNTHHVYHAHHAHHNHAHISPIYPERSRERLRRDLMGLSEIEYREIFNMIRQRVGQYSENKNGIFINLRYVDDELVDKIYDFLEFSRKNKMYLKELEEKQNDEKRRIDTSLHQQHNTVLSRDNVANQVSQLSANSAEEYSASAAAGTTKKTTVDNFTFQNFIDKLTITNMKMFPENERLVYPTIKQHKWNVSGVKARLLKKCKDINKYNYDRFLNPYITTDEDSAYMNSGRPARVTTGGKPDDTEYDSDAELDADNGDDGDDDHGDDREEDDDNERDGDREEDDCEEDDSSDTSDDDAEDGDRDGGNDEDTQN